MLNDIEILQILRDAGLRPTVTLTELRSGAATLPNTPTVHAVRMAYNRGLLDARRDPK